MKTCYPLCYIFLIWGISSNLQQPKAQENIMFLVGESLIHHSLQQHMAKDMLHVVHQGVAPLAIASLITHHHTESNPGLPLAGLDKLLKTETWQRYKTWRRVCPIRARFFRVNSLDGNLGNTHPEISSCYKGPWSNT